MKAPEMPAIKAPELSAPPAGAKGPPWLLIALVVVIVLLVGALLVVVLTRK